MPDVALLSASIPLLTPVLRNNWKVPEPACNCLGSLSNFRCAAATDPRKACYLLNFAKNSLFSGKTRRDRFASDCAHHHPVFANRTFPIRLPIGRFCGDFRPLTSWILVSADVRAF